MKTENKDKVYEIISYIFFGILTTLVGLGTYFAILFIGENLFKIAPDDAKFNYIRVVAEILQWVFAVLFAFFTNKKWVFKNVQEIPTVIQLARFAMSRLATLALDAAVTFGTVFILLHFDYKDISISFIGLDNFKISADLIAKIAASVLVVITNYILSKIFVFKSKKNEAKND